LCLSIKTPSIARVEVSLSSHQLALWVELWHQFYLWLINYEINHLNG
jgi:hypothetical protein